MPCSPPRRLGDVAPVMQGIGERHILKPACDLHHRAGTTPLLPGTDAAHEQHPGATGTRRDRVR
jgi:hypothetical protein